MRSIVALAREATNGTAIDAVELIGGGSQLHSVEAAMAEAFPRIPVR